MLIADRYRAICVLVVQEKEDWINSIGRAIVRHSRSMADREVLDYS